MRLNATYTRFFRSLNYDYIGASSETYAPDPCDSTPSGAVTRSADYPFVRLRLRPDITTVVGDNKSGKSLMRAAIAATLIGEEFDRSDFCRYSAFFGVDKALLAPEFGAEYTDITSGDVVTIEQMTGLENIGPAQRVAIFLMNTTPKLRTYLRTRWHLDRASAHRDAKAVAQHRCSGTGLHRHRCPLTRSGGKRQQPGLALTSWRT
ncbi:hypothetical protein MKUB_30110 [Mycobacterium kubicae]|uniref:Rad50/SbcC-type AAA domain-containing protein n=1 Tax=Mycobacterium kubicae TaxID=120959 RepID=A0AAX1JCE8_9MYCO|nr:hypothetical protein [Mycobacterium kubicae]MCV7094262.1 hypothetical protein [Mycobacterium kubicae]ORV98919.1 hypothetical protein AWC13_11995 [Mycobacterium kubicae]QNI09930.1 hypothetical protein GAN18_00650 [Mycobacterium kubicae]QPI38126.1 hypothetical protein I2456_00605 [Mycobacterium kubicae]GFG65521.1 hypothetical protein MKUB_30110 [Mycobacterium kubicae]